MIIQDNFSSFLKEFVHKKNKKTDKIIYIFHKDHNKKLTIFFSNYPYIFYNYSRIIISYLLT